MAHITPHPTLGLNPRMTRCPICGKEGNSIVLLGNKNYKITCEHCGAVNYGLNCGRCNNCNRHINSKREELGEFERIMQLCDECRAERDRFYAVAREGGVLFFCEKCGLQGAVKRNQFAMDVRKAHDNGNGNKYSEPKEDGTWYICGIKFTTCEEHENLGIKWDQSQQEDE